MCECLPVCMYADHVYSWYLRRLKEDVRFLGTTVTGSFEPPNMGAVGP